MRILTCNFTIFPNLLIFYILNVFYEISRHRQTIKIEMQLQKYFSPLLYQPLCNDFKMSGWNCGLPFNVLFIGLASDWKPNTKHQMPKKNLLLFQFKKRRSYAVLFSFQNWNDNKKLSLTFGVFCHRPMLIKCGLLKKSTF